MAVLVGSRCILPGAEGMEMSAEHTVDAPRGLLHLQDPGAVQMRQQMEEAATKVQKIERGRKARKQAPLLRFSMAGGLLVPGGWPLGGRWQVSEAGSSRQESSQQGSQQASQQLTVSEGDLLMPGESQESPEVAREALEEGE